MFERWFAQKRQLKHIGTALVLWLALGGMNGGEKNEGGQIPIPQESFGVTVTDNRNNVIEISRFTVDSKLYLKGQLGNATLTIPFDKIKVIRLTPAEAGRNVSHMDGEVTLRSGETIKLAMETTQKIYGLSRFGNYELFLKDAMLIQYK